MAFKNALKSLRFQKFLVYIGLLFTTDLSRRVGLGPPFLLPERPLEKMKEAGHAIAHGK
jgi:hypothetical protein